MKRSRKYLALIITAALMAGLTLPAYAAEDNTLVTAEENTIEADTGSSIAAAAESAAAAADLVSAENFPGLTDAAANAGEYVGTAPDLSIASKRRVTALPEAGTYEPDQLLVKVGFSSELQTENLLFEGIAEQVTPLFSVPAVDDVNLASEHGMAANWYLVKLSAGGDMLDDWNKLLSEDEVLAVEPDYKVSSESIDDIGSTDPYEHAQSWLGDMKAPEAWSKLSSGSTPGANIIVAVVDSGVDITHPDLVGNLWSDGSGYHGYDFVNEDTIPDDQNGHGTHVAGIIAAAKNSIGTLGVAYGAKIMAVKVLNDKGSGSDSRVISGIEYAATHNANIINLSLGGLGSLSNSQVYSDEIKSLSSRYPEILVVAAAGNNGLPTTYAGDSYYGVFAAPANTPGVLTVMAMGSKPAANGDWLASYSNYDADPGTGYEYELMAPGVSILSTRMGGGYTYMSGTSMACPAVAGAAAVLMGLGCKKNETWSYLANSGELRQGKTQPNKTVRSYHVLDLKAAIEAKEAGTAYNSVIANATVTAKCDNITVDGKTVPLSDLNTATNLYFKDSGMLSSLNLSLENLGAASGNVTVTGTVGGATVSGSVSSTKNGDIVTIPLTISGTPSKTVSVPVSLTITPHDSKGNALNIINVSRSFKAYDLTLPSGINYSGGAYRLTNSTVTVGGSSSAITPILCLPYNIYIDSGYTLNFQNAVIYEYGGTITVANGGYAYFVQSLLMSNGNFNCNGSNNNLQFLGCSVQDPSISHAKIVDQTQFYSLGKSNVSSQMVESSSIYSSGFYSMSALSVSCDVFAFNLINQCIASTLYASQIAEFNSFVDNGRYLSSQELKPLTVRTQDYHIDSQNRPYGFCYNCVVGPITVTNNSYTPALINNVYYQKVNAFGIDLGDGNLKSVLPSGVSDTIICAGGSGFSSSYDVLFQFSQLCPAFVIYMYMSYYTTDGIQIPYTLQAYFSTELESGCPLRCGSYTDPFCYGQDLSSNATYTNNSCTFSLSTAIKDKHMTEYYELADYYTKTYTFSDNSSNYYWATSMGGQSLYTLPVKFGFYAGLDVNVSPDQSGNPVLTWPTEDYEGVSGSYVKVFRSVNGGTESELATAGSATYTDSGLSAGNKYTYTVRVYNSSNYNFLSGSADYAINSAQTKAKIVAANTSQISSTLNIGCDKAISFTALELGLSYDEGSFDLSSISFSDEVKNSGLPYGIIKTADGEATLYIGQASGSRDVLPACTLATISAANTDVNSADALHVSLNSIKIDGSTSGWNTVGCSFVIRTASNKLSYSDDGSAVSMWRQMNDSSSVLISEYDSSGKMLQVLTPTKGASSDISTPAASYTNGKRLSVFYLDSSSEAPLREKVGITLP